jgi:hypothetical protein
MAALAGCRTNLGTAANVNGHRITDSDVNKNVTPTGPTGAGKSSAGPPRSQVLQFLVQEQVFTRTLSYLSKGKVPTDAQLATLHDEAGSVLLQTQLGGAALDQALRKGLPSVGIKPTFAKTYLRVVELEYAIIKSQQLSQMTQLVALIKKAHVKVTVSPRYGKWVPATAGLDGKPVVPSYLNVQPGAGGAAATSTGPAG